VSGHNRGRTSTGASGRLRRRALALATSLIAAIAPWLLGASPALAQPTLAPPSQIAGPAAGVALGGLVIARDGSGGLVFTQESGGTEHVFVSRLIGGAFQAPTQVDSGLPGPASQPVISGTNGGLLQVAFIEAGSLFVTGTTSTTSGWSSPQPFAPDASNPSISINTFGEGYLAYTTVVGGGTDVDVDYFNGSTWAPASPQAVNATPNDNAGTGPDGASVVAAGDGVGIVAWGEDGHVYVRRVWGTMTSVAVAQLDPPTVSGWNELAADSPAVAAGGDSSYPDIAFREEIVNGTQRQSRVLLSRLIAEQTQPAATVDGLTTPGPEGSAQPGISMNEYGRGFVTSATQTTDAVTAAPLSTNGVPGGPQQVGSGLAGQEPYAVPSSAGLISTLIAWQDTTAPGSSQIVLRYSQDGTDLGTTQVASDPSLGTTDAAAGLAAGGDSNGDAAVAWVQGSGSQMTVDAAQLYQQPSAPVPSLATAYTTQVHPTLSWTPSRAVWGPLTYTVTFNGSTLAQTQGTSVAVPSTLIDGPYSWQVKVADPAGLVSTSSRATVFVDTQTPRLRALVSGVGRVGQPVALHLGYFDPPNPSEPTAQASGVATLSVAWGRATPVSVTPSATGTSVVQHVFAVPGFYRLTITAADHANNAVTIVRLLRILPAVAK
jgi:hypothetical protein